MGMLLQWHDDPSQTSQTKETNKKCENIAPCENVEAFTEMQVAGAFENMMVNKRKS